MRIAKPDLGWMFLVVALLSLVSCEQAHAEVFHTARTLKPRALSLGLEPQVMLVQPPAYQLNLHGGLGLAQAIDLGILYELPLTGAYAPASLGVDVEVGILSDSAASPALSFALGAHVDDWNWYYLDGTLMLSKVFHRFEPFVALDVDLSLPPAEVVPRFRLVGGLDFHLSRVTELIIELGIGLRGNTSYLSAGFNFYI